MIILSSDASGADVRLATDELWMLISALNDVCGRSPAIPDPDFKERIGYEREVMRDLLEALVAVATRNAH
jgi:hypothetical protein